MDDSRLYLLAADAVLLLHVVFVLFVIVSLVLIYLGRWFSWIWVRNPWFRLSHLMAIGVVVIQAWFGAICPLTTLEMHLRNLAGVATYDGSFISHWLGALLYYHAPPWVFIVAYTVFGLAVLASWFVVRPRPFAARAVG